MPTRSLSSLAVYELRLVDGRWRTVDTRKEKSDPSSSTTSAIQRKETAAVATSKLTPGSQQEGKVTFLRKAVHMPGNPARMFAIKAMTDSIWYSTTQDQYHMNRKKVGEIKYGLVGDTACIYNVEVKPDSRQGDIAIFTPYLLIVPPHFITLLLG